MNTTDLNQPVFSLGAKVFIYTFSVMFDLAQLLISLAFWGAGLTLSIASLGIGTPVFIPTFASFAIVINKSIQIYALIFFFFVYLYLLQSRKKTKIKITSFIKKATIKAGVAQVAEFIPFLGLLPFITLSNWLFINTAEKYYKKQREKVLKQGLDSV